MPRGVYERKENPTVAEAAAEEVSGKDPLHRTKPSDVHDAVAKRADIAYLALKPMKVAGERVQPGEIVQGAETWRNVHNYVSAGYLAVVNTNS